MKTRWRAYSRAAIILVALVASAQVLRDNQVLAESLPPCCNNAMCEDPPIMCNTSTSINAKKCCYHYTGSFTCRNCVDLTISGCVCPPGSRFCREPSDTSVYYYGTSVSCPPQQDCPQDLDLRAATSRTNAPGNGMLRPLPAFNSLARVGSGWQPAGSQLPAGFKASVVDAIDPLSAVAVLQAPGASGTYRTTDGGASWQKLTSMLFYDLAATDAMHLWGAAPDASVLATTDGGSTWATQFSDPGTCTFMNYVEMFTPSEGIAVGDGQYVAGSGWTPPAVLRTTDGGVHWNSMNTEPIGYSTDVWRTMCFLSSDVGFYFGTEAVPASGLFSTVNSGASWSEMGLNLSGASVVKFYDNMIGIVVALPGYKSIFRTTDGGATWQNVVQPFSGYAQDVEFVPGNPDRVWLGGFGGLFYSADTGKTWTNVLPGVFRDIDFVNAEIGWAVGDSIIYLTTTGGVVSVGAGENRMPSTFSLEQNYPNPFNPSTTIRYGLPDRSYVTIVVFNTAGQKVATLVDGETEAGYHEVRFDASRLASGVYLYRLQAGSYVETRKLLFVR